MKVFYAIATLALCPFWTLLRSTGTQQLTGVLEPIAVIELFSSQGCSSCPPADRLLSKTIEEAEKNKKNIFALSFHVDYWNRLGWKDPFSDKKFSDRQAAYTNTLRLTSNYTPQMIVNGTTEFVGSDAKVLDRALATALKTKPNAGFKKLEVIFDSNNKPTVHYELQGDYQNNKLNIALASLTEKTQIKRGENLGLTLVNEHVVYQFITKDAEEKGDLAFLSGPVPVKENMLVVAFLQNPATLKITGAAQAKFN